MDEEKEFLLKSSDYDYLHYHFLIKLLTHIQNGEISKQFVVSDDEPNC